MNTPGAGRNPRADDALSRGVLGLFGLLALLAVAAALLGRPGLELVWIDLRRVPEGLRYAVLGACGVLWIGWAQRPASGWRRAWTLATIGCCAAAMAVNACVVALLFPVGGGLTLD